MVHRLCVTSIAALCVLLVWSGMAAAAQPRGRASGRPDSAEGRRADMTRVRRLLAERPGSIRSAARAEVSRVHQEVQDQDTEQEAEVVPAGVSKAGAIGALLTGVGLFGYFLSRGPTKLDDELQLRGERSEMVDFTIFAGAVTLIGTGVVMLVSGS